MHVAQLCQTPKGSPDPNRMEVPVPMGAVAGSTLSVSTPDGGKLKLTIPGGVPAGATLMLVKDESGWKCSAVWDDNTLAQNTMGYTPQRAFSYRPPPIETPPQIKRAFSFGERPHLTPFAQRLGGTLGGSMLRPGTPLGPGYPCISTPTTPGPAFLARPQTSPSLRPTGFGAYAPEPLVSDTTLPPSGSVHSVATLPRGNLHPALADYAGDDASEQARGQAQEQSEHAPPYTQTQEEQSAREEPVGHLRTEQHTALYSIPPGGMPGYPAAPAETAALSTPASCNGVSTASAVAPTVYRQSDAQPAQMQPTRFGTPVRYSALGTGRLSLPSMQRTFRTAPSPVRTPVAYGRLNMAHRQVSGNSAASASQCFEKERIGEFSSAGVSTSSSAHGTPNPAAQHIYGVNPAGIAGGNAAGITYGGNATGAPYSVIQGNPYGGMQGRMIYGNVGSMTTHSTVDAIPGSIGAGGGPILGSVAAEGGVVYGNMRTAGNAIPCHLGAGGPIPGNIGTARGPVPGSLGVAGGPILGSLGAAGGPIPGSLGAAGGPILSSIGAAGGPILSSIGAGAPGYSSRNSTTPTYANMGANNSAGHAISSTNAPSHGNVGTSAPGHTLGTNSGPSHGSIGTSSAPGHGTIGAISGPDCSSTNSTSAPVNANIGSNSAPGHGNIGANSSPGHGNIGANSAPGQGKIGAHGSINSTSAPADSNFSAQATPSTAGYGNIEARCGSLNGQGAVHGDLLVPNNSSARVEHDVKDQIPAQTASTPVCLNGRIVHSPSHNAGIPAFPYAEPMSNPMAGFFPTGVLKPAWSATSNSTRLETSSALQGQWFKKPHAQQI